ncbi:MAG: acetolactate synthase small subunit [Lachnospiraceae bacterium]|jgi:acetolactate synthase-1/3 small subunit|nr:acetolactate synthase small subunit [Lachnospiraceae bacterium]
MKKRWLCLFVENEVGVLAGITGLFSGKFYNLESLTVGVTEDKSISRITIGLTGDDRTFEQVKKQLNRCVEVIKVIDYTDTAVFRKELMFVRIRGCSEKDREEIFRIAQVFDAPVVDCNRNGLLMESVKEERDNDRLIALLEKHYVNHIEVVRGGSVAVEAL